MARAANQEMSEMPTNGTTITFIAPPTGSYAKIGETYLVKIEWPYIHLKNTKTGSGTFDKKWAYRNAKFVVSA